MSDDEGDIDANYHTELDDANNHAELEDANNQVEPDTPTTVVPANLPEPPMIPPVISAPPPHLPSVASNPTGTDDSDSGNNNIAPPSLSHNISDTRHSRVSRENTRLPQGLCFRLICVEGEGQNNPHNLTRGKSTL